MRKPPRPVTVADRDEMIRLYRSEVTIYRIAGMVGRNPATVREVLIRAGVHAPAPVSPRPLDVELFFRHVEVAPDLLCWLWTGTVYNGAPRLRLGSSSYPYARRFAYRFWRGKIPTGHEVRMRCGNRLCVNPDHMTTEQAGRAPWAEVEEYRRSDLLCEKGHLMIGGNARTLILHGESVRRCNTCRDEWTAQLLSRPDPEEEDPREAWKARIRAQRRVAA